MPMYDFHCPHCGDEWEQLARIEQVIHCDGCQASAQRLISAAVVHPDNYDTKSYYDDGLGVRIESRSQRKRIMRDRGLEELGASANKHGTHGTAYSFPGRTASSAPVTGHYERKR